MGNYVYAYNDQLSEKKEEGNLRGDVKGHYAYTMPNGLQRQVKYVADNSGFHVRDNADPARIKRSSEPNLLQTKMTSVMDSTSLRDGSRNMQRISNIMGHGMSNDRHVNMLGMDQQSYSNMMGRNIVDQDRLDRLMTGQDSTGRN